MHCTCIRAPSSPRGPSLTKDTPELNNDDAGPIRKLNSYVCCVETTSGPRTLDSVYCVGSKRFALRSPIYVHTLRILWPPGYGGLHAP